MPNPFPGMDPWMEDQWGDAHHRMIVYGSDQIRPLLPPDLRPRIEERVFVESPLGEGRQIFPDLRVVEHAPVRVPPGAGPAGENTATAEPLVLDLGDDPITEGLLQIIDTRSGGRVVTVIEVLSPSNKRSGEGQRLYRQKQQECLEARVNLVEIDLLRAGQRVLAVPEYRVPEFARAPYRVCVWRAARPLAAEWYPISIRQRLPVVKVPLRPTDADVPLDLQPLLDQAYVNGSYDDTDYDADPVPPLSADDAAWADGVLRARGLRGTGQ
jgi:hypothetical protein